MSAENPWTPGPWTAFIHQSGPMDDFVYLNGADARLIALAPEMAELLEEILAESDAALSLDSPQTDLAESIRDLLARARGEVAE